MGESSHSRRRYGLPTPKSNVAVMDCGICDSSKVEDQNGMRRCPHCDVGCARTSHSTCHICQAGMRGLPEPEERRWVDER